MNESKLQEAVCNYIAHAYPHVLFRSDCGGIRLTPGRAVKLKKVNAGRGWPDLFIAEPRGQCCGLFLELKAEGARVWKKDGTPANEHILEQASVLAQLKVVGYKATFAQGFDQAKKIIDWYLNEL